MMEAMENPLPNQHPSRERRTNRPPLCTFFNHLGPGGPKASKVTTFGTKKGGKKKKQEANQNEAGDVNMKGTVPNVIDEDDYDNDYRRNHATLTEPLKTSVSTAPETPATAKLTVTFSEESYDFNDDDDDISVETVNTSNKSVDLYLRSSSHKLVPAVKRWKEPPPPQVNPYTLLLEGLYITSRCESDSEEELPPKPVENIVIRKRGRCPRLQQARYNRKSPKVNLHKPKKLLSLSSVTSMTSSTSSKNKY